MEEKEVKEKKRKDGHRNKGASIMKYLVPKTALLAVILLLATPAALAVPGDNQGTGDVAGDAAALIDSNVFNLTATGNMLTLTKRAFLTDGTALTSGNTLPTGTPVKFMIYVNNDSTVGMTDLSVQDVLDLATFTYTAGSLKVDNSQTCAAFGCTVGEESSIFTAVDATSPLSDVVDSNVISHVTGTIDAGNAVQANGQLDINASGVWAMSFTVTMN